MQNYKKYFFEYYLEKGKLQNKNKLQSEPGNHLDNSTIHLESIMFFKAALKHHHHCCAPHPAAPMPDSRMLAMHATETEMLGAQALLKKQSDTLKPAADVWRFSF